MTSTLPRRDYCKKLSLYRKRAWTCRLTGRTGLTYEEALACEARAKGGLQEVRNSPSKLQIALMTDAVMKWTMQIFGNLAAPALRITVAASICGSHLP